MLSPLRIGSGELLPIVTNRDRAKPADRAKVRQAIHQDLPLRRLGVDKGSHLQ